MNTSDLVSMLDRVGQSLFPVQALLTGFGYMLGIIFFIIAIRKFYVIGNSRATSGSGERMFVPTVYLMGGALLIFFPTTFKIVRNTVFGIDSPLAYAPYDPFNFYSAFGVIVQTVGILWFIRGTSLLIQSSNPGVQHGPKGLIFLVAGIMAMNFDQTINVINGALSWLEQTTLTARQGLGY